MTDRGYQHEFSDFNPEMHNEEGRRRKAATMVAVLKDYLNEPLKQLSVLDVGASTGHLDAYLAPFFGSVTGIDIDSKAVSIATKTHSRENLFFREGDALNIGMEDNSVDVVICSQVYEHVPDSRKMVDEIFRILRPGGVCYFAASNRLMWNEPHYNLPLLSVIPRSFSHWYVRMAGRASFYHELHLSYWGLKKLVGAFEICDYTGRIIENPVAFGATYMIPPKSVKARIARFIVRYAYWLVPGYIWLLKKPVVSGTRRLS